MNPTEYKKELIEYDDYNPVEENNWHENGHKYTKIIQLYHGNHQIIPPYTQKRREINFKDDKQDGLYTEWQDNGKKEWEVNYKDDELHGLITSWDEDGKRNSEVNYKEGKRHGLAIFWDDEEKEFEESYNDGEVISQTYFKDGEIIERLEATACESLSPDFYSFRCSEKENNKWTFTMY
ncbi:MAG: hypothetical protein M0Q44_06860 [Methylobacter sp.]|jgi:antitoxin component YwqK of YwqJK toxin-antitoxin module|nr:hypothetical protein [Methylobacter sp.]